MQADIKSKDTFIIRKKYQNQILKLTTEEKAELLDKIFEYQTTGEIADGCGKVDMLLSIMIDERKQDDEKYLDICEKNRENGKLGGAKPGNQNARKNWEKQPKQPNGGKNNHTPPKQADKGYMINDIEEKEKDISKDISKKEKEEEFEKFWKEYPHARKGKKSESYNYFIKQNSDEVMKQVVFLKRKIKAGLRDAQYIPACERWIRDFTPINEDVIKQDLKRICKWHLNAPGDRKERSIELKQDFGETTIKDIIKQLNTLQVSFTT